MSPIDLPSPSPGATDFRTEYHVAIAGGGLVGLLLAILLRQARFPVTVFEEDVELKEIGAGIILPPPATRALRLAGVLQAVQTHGIAPKDWTSHSYHRDQTTPLARLGLDPAIQQAYGVPYLVIHRAHLRRILYDAALASGAQVILGRKVDVAATDWTNGVVYTVGSVLAAARDTGGSDGSEGANSSSSSGRWEEPEPEPEGKRNGKRERETFRADLLVAADGQASGTRALLVGHERVPRSTGRTVHRVLMEKARMYSLGMADLVEPSGIHVWFGPRSLAVGYLLGGDFNVALTVEDGIGVGKEGQRVEEKMVKEEEEGEGEGIVERGRKFEAGNKKKGEQEEEKRKQEEPHVGPRPSSTAELQQLYDSTWDPRIQTLVQHGRGFLKWELLDYTNDGLASWTRPRQPDETLDLVLTGDAAHAIGPFIGCGAALGFESASLLALLLSRTRDRRSIPQTLRRYEALRRPRTEKVRDVTAEMGRVWMLPDRKEQEERDRALRGGPGTMERTGGRGYPMALMDEGFQGWLFGYDPLEE